MQNGQNDINHSLAAFNNSLLMLDNNDEDTDTTECGETCSELDPNIYTMPNHYNNYTQLDDNYKSVHNSTSSSGYGFSLSSDSSTSYYNSSHENSINNPNDSIFSIPNTPKTPSYSFQNSNDNSDSLLAKVNYQQQTNLLNQQMTANDLIARFGVNLVNNNNNNNNDILKKASIENSLLNNYMRQTTPNQSLLINSKKSMSLDATPFNYDPFNDYTGIDKMMNQQGSLNIKKQSPRNINDNELNSFQTKLLSDNLIGNRTLENFDLRNLKSNNNQRLFQNQNIDSQNQIGLNSINNNNNRFTNNFSNMPDFNSNFNNKNSKTFPPSSSYMPNKLNSSFNQIDKFQNK